MFCFVFDKRGIQIKIKTDQLYIYPFILALMAFHILRHQESIYYIKIFFVNLKT